MRILGIFLNNEIRTGGHKRYLELMEGLAESGCGVTVLMNKDLEWEPTSFHDVRISAAYRKGNRPFTGSLFRKAVRLSLKRLTELRDNQFDALLVFGESNWGSAREIAKKKRIPINIGLRSDLITENQMILRHEKLSVTKRTYYIASIAVTFWKERAIAQGASQIFFQSEADQTRFLTRHPKASIKCVVIRNDIRRPRFTKDIADSNKSTQCRKLLFIGNFGVRKGLQYLLSALSLLKESGIEEFTLDIVAGGTGFSPLKSYIDDAGLGPVVRFCGFQEDPLPLIRDSDLLVVPSIFDSYPNTILEALHVGTPVIGSATGGIPDMLRSQEILFEPASAPAIASKLSGLIRDNDNYQRVRILCAARRSYFDFDWPAEWLRALNKAIS